MATTVLQVGYRPLRLGFLVRPNSLNDVAKAIQLCSLLWGGSFNPIIPVTGPEVDDDIAALEVDGFHAVAETDAIAGVIERHPYLRWNYFRESLIAPDGLLAVRDITPMLQMLERRWRESPPIQPVVLPSWEAGDPMRGVYASTYGDLTLDQAHTGEEIRARYVRATGGLEESGAEATQGIDRNLVPLALTRLALQWQLPVSHDDIGGVFVGNPASAADVAAYWNLRASGHDVLFWNRLDPDGGPFRTAIVSRIDSLLTEEESAHGWFPVFVSRSLRGDVVPSGLRAIAGDAVTFRPNALSSRHGSAWRWLALAEPPGAESRGVLSHVEDEELERSKVVVPLPPLPFPSLPRSPRQAVVVSVGSYTDEGYSGTLRLPPLPDLNGWYRSEITQLRRPIRAGAETFGVIEDLLLETLDLWPLPEASLLRRLFGGAGIGCERSEPGELAHHLRLALGGLSNASVLRLKGVRKLLSEPKARSGIMRAVARQLIQDKGSIDRARNLWLRGDQVTAEDIFSLLVARRIFLPGLELKCPRCRSKGFYSMRSLDDEVRCSRCGLVFAVGPTLVRDPIRFRLSALLDDHKDDPSQPSAIPVLLTLLFVRDWLGGTDGLLLETSCNLTNTDGSKSETDFVAVSYGSRPTIHTHLLVGECKGEGRIDASDLRNLGAVASAVRSSGIRADIVLSTTRDSFDDGELALCHEFLEAGGAHGAPRPPPILLTRRDLEKGPFEDHDSATRDLRFRGLEGLVEYSQATYFANAEL